MGMGRDLYEHSPQARNIFDQADQVLGFHLTKLAFDGPFEELTRTQNCQPAILAASIAALAALRHACPTLAPAYVAGLSLGEYSALVAAGVADFASAVYLVRKRGEFMEEAAKSRPGKMGCVLGLEREAVEELCRRTGAEVANLNCPGQVVVSGSDSQFEALSEAALNAGARRVLPLDVSGAFHSSLMDGAGLKLASEIKKISFGTVSVPLVSNVDSAEHTEPEAIKDNLIKQVNSPVYWEKSMRYLLGRGINCFFEIGPGSVLKGLMKKIDASARVVNAGKWDEIQEVGRGML